LLGSLASGISGKVNMKVFLCSVGLAILLAACSSGGGVADAGLEDVHDGAGDDGPDDESFLVIVPPGTGLCSTFFEGRDWRQEYQMLGRIDLRPGNFILPRKAGTFPLDVVEQVLFRPERTGLAAAGAGEVLAEFYDWGGWSYQFTQEYAGEGRPLLVTVELFFYSPDGIWPEETVLGADTMLSLISGGIKIGTGEDWITEVQALGPCALPEDWKRTITATTAGGDRLVLDLRGSMPCMTAGNTSCYSFQSAQVALGTYQARVEDHFRLVYSAGHHNEGEHFLILLDPPAEQTAALLVVAPPLASTEGGELVGLDADLVEIGRETFSDWQSTF
jgi:hypothetical protein